MSAVIVWGQSADQHALEVGGGQWQTYTAASVVGAATHYYESLPPPVEWESSGSPAGPADFQTLVAFTPSVIWDSAGVPTQSSPADPQDYDYRIHALPLPVVGSPSDTATAAGPVETLDVGTTPSITITGFSPSLVELEMLEVPYGIYETITGYPPTLIETDDSRIDVPLASAINVFGFAPTLFESTPTDEQLLVPTADITVTGYAPDFVDGELLETPTAQDITLTAFAPTLNETALLPPVLSYSDAKVIWDLLLFDGYTPRDMLRIIAAAVAGRCEGALEPGVPGTMTFKNLDGTKTLITAQLDGIGNRITVTLTP